jgi:hypothetical protein
MNHEPNIKRTGGDACKGAAVYTPLALALYDLAVLGLSKSFVWQCASHVLLDFYNEHISDKHLDIGVGTGYFLDGCRLPPRIVWCSVIFAPRSKWRGNSNMCNECEAIPASKRCQ